MTAPTFSVGEIAVIKPTDDATGLQWPEYMGVDVEVVGGLMERSVWTNRAHTAFASTLCYLVRAADGKELCAYPENLRKKRPPPPRQETTTWDLCPWWPEHVVRRVPA